MRARVAIAVVLGVAAACGGKRDEAPRAEAPPPPPVPRDVAPPAGEATAPWAALAEFPRVTPERVVTLPARPDVPRFDVGGPVLAGDLAIVASSQFGFLAVDWRRGAIAWSKPSGSHVAPPLVLGKSVVLVGSCLTPPELPDDELLLGCLRVVTHAGADEAYTAVRGARAAVGAFAAEAGAQQLWRIEGTDRAVRWRRGEHAVSIDLMSGVARPADAAPPPLVVRHGAKRWDVRHDPEGTEGRILASQHGKLAWQTENAYTALIGAIYLPDHSPLLRIANLTSHTGDRELMIIDIDATGSLRGAIGRATPGIGLLGWDTSSVGDAAIAVRMDDSLQRDYVVGYAANAMLMWVFPLPEIPRADPVGVALAPEAVVVFHDGDTLSILPELSAPPTAPGAARAASQNPTP